MNKSGIQAQLADAPFKALVEATTPYCLKILHGARDLPLVNAWANRRRAMGGGVLILRYVAPDTVSIGDLAGLTGESLRLFDGWQALAGGGVVVILELGINEKFHTDLGAFADLAEASDPAVEAITDAGFWAGVLVTSEGNPPGADYGAPFFLQPRVLALLRKWRRLPARKPGRRVIWVPHGYSHPPAAPDDEWHFDRPRRILERLPEDARLNYAFGEMGCDGGCDLPDKKPGVGWQGYFGPDDGRIRRYADFCRTQVRAMAADPLCVGGAFFLSGADPNGRPNFVSFDVRDEVDFRPVLTESVPGPPIVWLPPAPAPSSPGTPPSSPALPQEAPVIPDWYPPAVRRPISRNFTPGRAGRVPLLIVDHIADGLGSPFGWFDTDRGDDGSSAHFWVSRTGTVEQYRPLTDTCWANGPKCQPDLTNPVIADLVGHLVGMNSVTVAVEHEGKPGVLLTQKQIAASRALHRWLSTNLRIALDRTHVIGHYQIDKCTRANCPGPTHPWQEILMPDPTPTSIDALRDQSYALAHQLRGLKAKWQAAGYPQTAEGIDAAANAAERFISVSKGEK